MLGFNGGLMGVRRVPTGSAATGLWLQNEQSVAKRAAIWPQVVTDPTAGLSPILWYDFSDEATVTTASGQITQITDKGSRGWTLAKSSTGPTYATTINGKKCSDWGTVSHSNFLRNTSSTSTNIAEIYCVQDSSDTTSFANGGSNSGLLGSWSDTSNIIIVNGTNTGFEGPFNMNRLYINGGTSNTWSNVFPAIASPSLVRITKNDGDVIATDGGFQIGKDRGNFGRGWRGLIAEVICFSSVLNSTDRNSLQTWLAFKWGITLA
jgi:hypothetical protein